MNPSDSILPILRLSESGEYRELLGTGFLAGDRPMVVSARHVFDYERLEDGDVFGSAIPLGDGTARQLGFDSDPYLLLCYRIIKRSSYLGIRRAVTTSDSQELLKSRYPPVELV